MLKTYRPSGQWRVSVFIHALIAAAFVAVGAVVYQLIVYYIPLIYLTVLATVGFGAVIGAIGGRAIRAGHCRSPVVGMLIAAVLALVGVAVSHVVNHELYTRSAISDAEAFIKEHGSVATHDEVAQVVRAKYTFGEYIADRVETGWHIGKLGRENTGNAITGVMVYVVWVVEALIIMFGAGLISHARACSPYCEKSGTWPAKATTILALPNAGPETVKAITDAKDVPDLFALLPDNAGELTVKYELSCSTLASDVAFLTISTERDVFDKKGQKTRETTKLHTNLEVDPNIVLPLADAAKADLAKEPPGG